MRVFGYSAQVLGAVLIIGMGLAGSARADDGTAVPQASPAPSYGEPVLVPKTTSKDAAVAPNAGAAVLPTPTPKPAANTQDPIAATPAAATDTSPVAAANPAPSPSPSPQPKPVTSTAPIAAQADKSVAPAKTDLPGRGGVELPPTTLGTAMVLAASQPAPAPADSLVMAAVPAAIEAPLAQAIGNAVETIVPPVVPIASVRTLIPIQWSVATAAYVSQAYVVPVVHTKRLTWAGSAMVTLGLLLWFVPAFARALRYTRMAQRLILRT